MDAVWQVLILEYEIFLELLLSFSVEGIFIFRVTYGIVNWIL